MKVVFRSKYVPPAVLNIQEIDKPTPTDNEGLIRVYAASVSRTDNHVLTGRPFIMRLFTGLFKPKLAVRDQILPVRLKQQVNCKVF